MANTRVLVTRRKAVRNTRKITKTMEKISTAKLAKAQHAAISARPYANKLKEIIGQVAAASADIKHPLLEAHDHPKKAVVILLTSDRGLCGAFNSNLVKAAKTLISELKAKGRDLEFIVQGKKGIGAFKYLNLPIAERLIGVSDKPAYSRAEQIADKLIERYGRKDIDEVYMVYSAFKGPASQMPVSEMILPLSGLKGESAAEEKGKPAASAKKEPEGAGYIFHPNPTEILTQVLPLVVKMTVFTAMLQNTASEHAARRVAMKNATDSADDMIKALSRAYNRARQGKITQEIAEIVGGANALA
ncbi:MAG TPA: ATP synthase F1 subunit gamma [Planctomycetota bacterium]|nr:ATP synthase F1 subunit gamma [Planctomycetota bacterium]